MAEARKWCRRCVPAVVALAPVGFEGVVQRLAGAGLLLLLLAGLGPAAVAEVVGVRVQPQEADEAVQLAHPILHKTCFSVS